MKSVVAPINTRQFDSGGLTPSPLGTRARILMLVESGATRRLLENWLTECTEEGIYHEVLTAEQVLDEDFDLGILDAPMLHRLWDQVRRKKEQDRDVFLPFVLITPVEDIGLARREWRRSVDEVVIVPTDSIELQARLEALLRARRLSLELAGEIAQRQRVAAEREQLQAETEQRKAEITAINKEFEGFSYAVSHDLRAPLRHIEGFSSILLESYADRLDEQGEQYLHLLVNGARKMKELLDALLKFSRITRAEMRRQPVNLSEIVGLVINELREVQPNRQVEVAIAPDVVADGDPQLLRMVMENLLGNAWKFTSNRPVARIEFSQIQRDHEAVFVVSDNGAGFGMPNANKLFQPFQRLHRPEEFPGTGMGLATVQRIISRHGGRIWAEGEVDKGATFHFVLS